MKGIVDTEEYQKIQNKIKMYHNESDITMEEISDNLREIFMCYSSDNTDLIKEKNDEIKSKFNVIDKEYENYYIITTKILELYKDTSLENKDVLEMRDVLNG